MKFDCGETWEETKERLGKWHRFFAIWPRKVGPNDCRWLEWIERRGNHWSLMFYSGWDWEYRSIKP